MPVLRVPNLPDNGITQLIDATNALEAAGNEVTSVIQSSGEFVVFFRPARGKPGPKPQVR